MKNGLKDGINSFKNLIENVDLCPDIDYDGKGPGWSNKIYVLERFLEAFIATIKESEKLVAEVKESVTGCETWSVIISLDLDVSVLGLGGRNVGIYVTRTKQEIDEIGIVRGFTADR